MSLQHSTTIKCPECGKEGTFRIWSSINTALDPEMKAAVRDQSAFLFTCPECGAQNSVDYGFLYHQMEDQIMIHYANSDENAEEIEQLLRNGDSTGMIKGMLDHGYIFRIVRSRPELLEKLAIFDAGLDDRIVEIFKLMVLAKVREDNPDAESIREFFVAGNDDENFIQVIIDNKPIGYAPFSLEDYESIKNAYVPVLDDIHDDGPYVDRQRAIEIFHLSYGDEE